MNNYKIVIFITVEHLQKIDELQSLIEQSSLYGAYKDAPDYKIDLKIVLPLSRFLMEAAVELGLENIEVICKEIVPKTVGFCGLVGNGFVDPKDLMPLMQVTSIAYLFDQTTDRTDTPEIYLPHIKGVIESKNTSLNDKINCAIAEFPPQYRKLIRKLAYEDVSLQEYFMRICSIMYFKDRNSAFIDTNKAEIVKATITNGGLQLVACGTYMLLHKFGVVNTPLEVLINRNARFIRILDGFLRISDDFGDIENDRGTNINIFNEEGRRFINEFMIFCNIDPTKYTNHDEVKLFEAFYEASKRELGNITEYPRDEQIFLTLLLRVMEGGFINIVGDNFLVEGSNTGTIERAVEMLRTFNYKL